MSDAVARPIPLTLKQLAAAIEADYPETSITVKVLRRFLVQGLPHMHIGNTIFLLREDYDGWILAQRTTTFTAFRSEKKAEAGA